LHLCFIARYLYLCCFGVTNKLKTDMLPQVAVEFVAQKFRFESQLDFGRVSCQKNLICVLKQAFHRRRLERDFCHAGELLSDTPSVRPSICMATFIMLWSRRSCSLTPIASRSVFYMTACVVCREFWDGRVNNPQKKFSLFLIRTDIYLRRNKTATSMPSEASVLSGVKR